jgi:hypothetical protein
MTKKHFNALARALYETRPKTTINTPEYKQWVKCRNEIASTCQEFNPRFDRGYFFSYIDDLGKPKEDLGDEDV